MSRTSIVDVQDAQVLTINTLARQGFFFGQREVRLPNRKTAALLGYLAISETGSETRERLLALLWSAADEARARASLRQAIYEIRVAFQPSGFAGFGADKHRIALDPATIVVDLHAVLAAARAGEAHPLLLEQEQLVDSMLDGFDSVDPEFATWLAAKRVATGRRLARDLEKALRGGNDPQGSEALAQALLGLDPSHEEAARELMRCRTARGDIAGALKIYKALWDMLAEEYDTEPSRETQELIASIKLADGPPRPAATPPPRAVSVLAPPEAPAARAITAPDAVRTSAGAQAAELAIAVGPFAILGPSQERDYLIHGFRQELLAQLVRFREWRVRDATVAAPDQFGAGAEYIIDGSAILHQGEARLVVNLRNRATGDYLWSERVPIAVENWFEAQKGIVQSVASALNIYISARRLAALANTPGDSPSAFDRWLRGQAMLLSWSPQRRYEAADIFRQIIADSPDFAPAYSSLAGFETTLHLTFPGVFRSREREASALAFARGATRLDPLDARAQLALGWAFAMTNQHDQSSAHHRIASELNDSDPWVLSSTALGASFRGEIDLARRQCAVAFDISPAPNTSQWGYRAEVAFLRGDYRDCIAAAESAQEIVHILGWKVAALGLSGEKRSANDALAQFYRAAGAQWFGSAPPSAENIARWFVHAFPIKHRDDWERLREGFEAAGGPRTSVVHNLW